MSWEYAYREKETNIQHDERCRKGASGLTLHLRREEDYMCVLRMVVLNDRRIHILGPTVREVIPPC